MAQLPTPFNAHMVEPSNAPVAQLPVSDSHGHLVIITASEFKQSRSNTANGYLELSLQVIDETPAKGATGSYRINLFNENKQAADIAQGQLSALCRVTNTMMVSDSQQLHNIPFRVIVGNQKPDSNKPDAPVYTEVKGVLDIHGNKPQPSNAAPQAAPQQSAAPAFAQPQQPQAAPQPWANPAPVAPQQPIAAAPAWQQNAPQAAPAPTGSVPPWATK